MDKPAGIFARRLEKISDQDRVLLQSVARVVLRDENEILPEQLDIRDSSDPPDPELSPTKSWIAQAPQVLAPRELTFNNGLGGFTPDGREYIITLQPERVTPAPWVNVVANPFFGTVISNFPPEIKASSSPPSFTYKTPYPGTEMSASCRQSKKKFSMKNFGCKCTW